MTELPWTTQSFAQSHMRRSSSLGVAGVVRRGRHLESRPTLWLCRNPNERKTAGRALPWAHHAGDGNQKLRLDCYYKRSGHSRTPLQCCRPGEISALGEGAGRESYSVRSHKQRTRAAGPSPICRARHATMGRTALGPISCAIAMSLPDPRRRRLLRLLPPIGRLQTRRRQAPSRGGRAGGAERCALWHQVGAAPRARSIGRRAVA